MYVDWIKVANRLPQKKDGDAQGCVLVWHSYQGVMLMGYFRVPENQFVTHWMTPPPDPARTDA